MRMCRKRTKNIILLITVTLILSFSLFLTFNQQSTTSNTLTIPTQPTNPTSSTSLNSKMGTHLQQLLQTSDPSTEYEMIIFFDGTVNYTQGINLLKNLGDFEIISNYTILDGICIKAPIKIAPIIAQQNYVSSITYNEEIKLAPEQITTNEIQAEDQSANNAIGASTLQTTYGLNGTGVVVAVLDTGINPHIDLPGSQIIYNQSFVLGESSTDDLNGHGTAVAGIIGASGINDSADKGVAPAVTFLNLKVLDKNGNGEDLWAINAIDEALTNSTSHPKANIISMSLGNSNGTSDDTLSIAANRAWNNGTIVVAAAGNEGGDGFSLYYGIIPIYRTINSPGLGAYIITVGSVDTSHSSVSYFSSRGPTDDNRSKPDIVAPGEDLTVLSNDNHSILHNYFSGTSAATPVVSGAIALLLDAHSNVSWISPNTVKAAIMMKATDLSDNPFSQGAGLININSAYNYLQDYYIKNATTIPPLIITPIRAITPPMTLSNTSITILNLTIVVGNLTNNTSIINATFSVNGNASAYTTLPPLNTFNLTDEQQFVPISFTVPPNMSVSNFSGTLMFVNISGNGSVLFTIPLSPPSVKPSLLYLLLLLFGSSRPVNNLLVIGGIVGIGAVVVIGLVAIVWAGRRKPKPPPEFFEFGQGEGPPPPPPPPPEPEPDWFT
ncbi:MAG: S8 family serine peptidase [Candidatus Freyarchaeum deiterrae]